LAYIQLPALPERSLAHGDFLPHLLARWGGRAGWPDAEALAQYRTALQVPFAAHSQLEQLRWMVRSAPRTDGARARGVLTRAPRVPVLHMHGKCDGLRPYGRAALSTVEVERFTDGYRFETLTQAGHFPAEQAPHLVNDRLLAWLATVAPAGGPRLSTP
jgi:pimeloyl-ACP methyl ester carboxylesterase